MNRGPGRPRLYPGEVKQYSVTVPKPLYDAICRVASEKNATLAVVTRAALRAFVLHQKQDTAPPDPLRSMQRSSLD